MLMKISIALMSIAMFFAGWCTEPQLLATAMASGKSPVGTWENTGKDDWVLKLTGDGKGIHYLIRQSDGALLDPVPVTWKAANDGSGNYLFSGQRFGGDCRMHLKNDNGNMSIRRESDGKLWVFRPK